ncbi:MAG: response regulator [Flavisolibacter sp.]|nr:response regulator [Flavisolibacter sp.]
MLDTPDVLNILLLEDNKLHVKVITGFLQNSGINCQWEITDYKEAYINALENKAFDIILADHQLTDFDSVGALEIRNEKAPFIPFIIITNTITEGFAIEIMKLGASDYIFKDKLQRLPVAIKQAIEKQKVEKAYHEVRERFELAAKATADVIWDFNVKENKVFFSEAIETLCGMQSGYHNPDDIKRFVHPNDLSHLRQKFEEAIEGDAKGFSSFFRIIVPDDSTRFVNLKALILRKQDGTAYRIAGVVQDTTEVTELQHQLLNQELERQKQISEITIKAQEKEREEIGKELHDNINQLLAAAKMMIDSAKTHPGDINTYLDNGSKAISEAIVEVRNISHAMIPPSFDESEFEVVLNDLADQMSSGGQVNIQINLPEQKELVTLDDEKKLAIYRIIQEQLNNILKYANATHVLLSITPTEDSLILVIEDDGTGFDMSVKSKGIGLKNIEKRAEFFGGRMSIISSPGQGCKLNVEIPNRNLEMKTERL